MFISFFTTFFCGLPFRKVLRLCLSFSSQLSFVFRHSASFIICLSFSSQHSFVFCDSEKFCVCVYRFIHNFLSCFIIQQRFVFVFISFFTTFLCVLSFSKVFYVYLFLHNFLLCFVIQQSFFLCLSLSS